MSRMTEVHIPAVTGTLGDLDKPQSLKVELLRKSDDPESAIQNLMGDAPEVYRMYRPGYNDYLSRMPKIDPTQADQSLQVDLTRAVLEEMRHDVISNLDDMNLPTIEPGKFGRVILALEEPKEDSGVYYPGTTIVLAIWGKGFASPVHGHAAGFLYEDLLRGNFDVHIFESTGEPTERKATYRETISQSEPGIFYTGYCHDHGQERRSAIIHNFVARELTMSMHYLPEQPRNGGDNRYTVVNNNRSGELPSWLQTMSFKPGFSVAASDVVKVAPQDMKDTWRVGDVYLVRSDSVSMLGDHFAMITSSDMIEKPHGLRPKDLSIPIPEEVVSPLGAYSIGEGPVLLKLNTKARKSFCQHYNLEV